MWVSLDIFGESNSLNKPVTDYSVFRKMSKLCQTTGNLITVCIPKLEDCQLEYLPGIYYKKHQCWTRILGKNEYNTEVKFLCTMHERHYKFHTGEIQVILMWNFNARQFWLTPLMISIKYMILPLIQRSKLALPETTKYFLRRFPPPHPSDKTSCVIL